VHELKVFKNNLFEVAAKLENDEVMFEAGVTARSLGFVKTEAKNGKQYTSVRWSRVNGYLAEVGFDQQVGEGDLLPESIVYLLAFKGETKLAIDFQKWLAIEVIPSIRKHGAYMTDDVLERTLNDPDYMIGLLTALKDEKQKRIEAEKTNHILMHVNKTYTATEIAKELGFKSATALNKDLENKRIQFKQNNTWVFYSKYADKGYVEIKQDVLDNGKVIYHRRFTQLGREFLLKLYERVSA
jgi:prophage antirepressor-like protein